MSLTSDDIADSFFRKCSYQIRIFYWLILMLLMNLHRIFSFDFHGQESDVEGFFPIFYLWFAKKKLAFSLPLLKSLIRIKIFILNFFPPGKEKLHQENTCFGNGLWKFSILRQWWNYHFWSLKSAHWLLMSQTKIEIGRFSWFLKGLLYKVNFLEERFSDCFFETV